MKIFISWSGDRSRSVAQIFHEWLPLVLHFAEPWTSHADIEAGERWATEVAKELEASNFGIICITKDNIAAPWILFEAGALAKSLQMGRAIPVLLDVEFKDISGPLAQFQAKKLDRDGLLEVVQSINRLVDTSVPEARLTQLFELAWPQFEAKIGIIPKSSSPAKSNRPQHEILEELVTGIRGLEMRLRDSFEDGFRSRRRRSAMSPMLIDEMLQGLRLGRRDPAKFLLMAAPFKDALPWVYELGVDAYRSSFEGDPKKHMAARERFLQSVKMLRRGPFLEEAGLDKSTYILVREMENFLLEEEISDKKGEN